APGARRCTSPACWRWASAVELAHAPSQGEDAECRYGDEHVEAAERIPKTVGMAERARMGEGGGRDQQEGRGQGFAHMVFSRSSKTIGAKLHITSGASSGSA